MNIVWRLGKRLGMSFGVLAAQVFHAAHRTDLPSLQNQDPSGDIGSPENPRLRIVLIGDSSITAPGIDIDACWPRRVAHALSDRYCVELRSVAIGGSKAADVLRDQLDAALVYEADMALMSIGANDALRAVPLRDYERDLDEIVRILTRHIPAVGISGVGDLGYLPRLPRIPSAWATVRSRSYDGAIRRVAARYDGVLKSVTWGPPWEAFNDRDHKLYAGDLFHASEEGHAVFGAAMLPVAERLLERLEPELSARQGSRGSST